MVNLSSYSLTPDEISVLDKGLSFSPTPKVDPVMLVSDTITFCRRLKWKFFWDAQSSPTAPATFQTPSAHPSLAKFKPPSPHEPKPLPANHPVEIFTNLLLSKVSDTAFLNSLHPSTNLSTAEKRALGSLRKNSDIVITSSDKGSTIVVLDSNDYLSEVQRQLSDTSSYTPTSRDLNPAFHRNIQSFLKKKAPKEGLSSGDISLLSPPHPRTPHFYILPKIHKTNNPGRPIVSSLNSPTERISSFVDHYLQPLVHSLPSYIKDTYDFLNRLHSTSLPVDKDIIMATIDVTSLYTSIPHEEGLASLRHFLDNRPTPQIPSTDFLVDLSRLILTKNAFSFNDRFFLQIKGCAMGSRFSPSYANLFLGLLEESFLSSYPLQPSLWLRYIDDIFLLWPHGEDSLSSFISALNEFSELSFTSHHSPSRITFLDVNISLENKNFITSVHIKPTNKQQYLHFNSCHPSHIKQSLPYSLSVRGHKICNNPESLDIFLNNLHHSLLRRGYPENLLRKKILHKTYKPKVNSNKRPSYLSLSTTYFPGVQALNRIIKSLFPFLSNSATTGKIFSSCPSLAFRRPPNLSSILKTTKPLSRFTTPTSTSPTPCKRPRCKTCAIFITESLPKKFLTFPLPSTPSPTCTTSNVIYILLCNSCPAFYIGLTTTSLNLRVNNHRASCNPTSPSASLPVPTHAFSHNLNFDDCFHIGILASLPPSASPLELKTLEQSCIWLHQALHPPGLNRAH